MSKPNFFDDLKLPGESKYPKTLNGLKILTPTLSRGTIIILCCLCLSANLSDLPITIKHLHFGSKSR